jgi:tetratricopeptide (TPR) repeat protein
MLKRIRSGLQEGPLSLNSAGRQNGETLIKVVIFSIVMVMVIGCGRKYLPARAPDCPANQVPLLSCKQESRKEDDALWQAWMHYHNDQLENALDLVERYDRPDSVCKDWWSILRGALYSQQGRYQEALESINRVRARVEKAYEALSDKHIALTSEEREVVQYIYAQMIGSSALASYHLKKWDDALRDFLIYIKYVQNADLYDAIAICYYRTRQYTKSLAYFTTSFQMHENGESKDYAAYNVGAVNAILGNVEETIPWWKIPLEHDRKKWLEMINSDKDFDAIRKDKRFIDFLNRQKG